MTQPLLDLNRLASVDRYVKLSDQSHAGVPVEAELERAVRARWAQHLGVHANDILLFDTAQLAQFTAVRVLLKPGEVALLARPLRQDWLAAIAHGDAIYVDVGRRYDGPGVAGRWHETTAQRAALAHPDAVAIVDTPAWGGADDSAAIVDLPLRCAIVDAGRCDDCLGPRLAPDRRALTVVCLRDPDSPSAAVLHGLVAPEGEGTTLRLLGGLAGASSLLAERAYAVLVGAEQQPAWRKSYWPRLEARYAEWCAALAERPGVQVLGRAGLEASAICWSGDSAAVAESIAGAFPFVSAWVGSGMRGLISVDLLR